MKIAAGSTSKQQDGGMKVLWQKRTISLSEEQF